MPEGSQKKNLLDRNISFGLWNRWQHRLEKCKQPDFSTVYYIFNNLHLQVNSLMLVLVLGNRIQILILGTKKHPLLTVTLGFSPCLFKIFLSDLILLPPTRHSHYLPVPTH